MLNCKNSTFFSKNSGKNLRISKNVCTFALEKVRQRRIASLKGADKTVKRAACNVWIAHRSTGAVDKTVKVAASKIYHTTHALFILTK